MSQRLSQTRLNSILLHFRFSYCVFLKLLFEISSDDDDELQLYWNVWFVRSSWSVDQAGAAGALISTLRPEAAAVFSLHGADRCEGRFSAVSSVSADYMFETAAARCTTRTLYLLYRFFLSRHILSGQFALKLHQSVRPHMHKMK